MIMQQQLGSSLYQQPLETIFISILFRQSSHNCTVAAYSRALWY